MEERNDFYTYAYLREDGTPYYIGKGTGRRWKKGHTVGIPPEERVLFLKTDLTEGEAHRHEVYMISVFGRKDIGTGILYNRTDGGEGTTGRIVTKEVRSAISEKLTGMPFTPERCKNISEGLKGKPSWNKGLKGHPSLSGTPPNQKGKTWWKNLELGKNVMRFECPGEGWEPGRCVGKPGRKPNG